MKLLVQLKLNLEISVIKYKNPKKEALTRMDSHFGFRATKFRQFRRFMVINYGSLLSY